MLNIYSYVGNVSVTLIQLICISQRINLALLFQCTVSHDLLLSWGDAPGFRRRTNRPLSEAIQLHSYTIAHVFRT